MSVCHAILTVIRIDPQGTMKILAVGDVGHIPPNMQSGTGADDPVLMVPAAPQDP
jgi:serine/threonine-protein phosphatase PGAM5